MIRGRYLKCASLLVLVVTACSEQRQIIDADLVIENVDVIGMASDLVDENQSVFIKGGVKGVLSRFITTAGRRSSWSLKY